MNMRKLDCNEHGGTFEIERKRGRPPTHCSEANPCSMVRVRKGPRTAAQKESAKAVAERTAETRRGRVPTRAQVKETSGSRRATRIESAKPATRNTPAASDVMVTHNPSIVLAKYARDLLEPQGWEVHGRAWTDEEDAWAEVTANRGTETMVARYLNGKVFNQEYSLWDPDKTPGQNGMPKTNLPFDPDEMTDAELAKELAGRKVTWWNRIGKNQETAIIGNKFQIHHYYEGTDESSRQVTFVDQTNGQYKFRSFNVAALMRVK